MSVTTPAPPVVYARERVLDLWAEITPLLERHWREIAHYPDIPLAVDRTAYEIADTQGALHVYTARAGPKPAGAPAPLVGYVSFLVRPNLHYTTSLQAVQDVLFVAPEARGAGVGRGLVAFADEQLRALGVEVVYHHVKLAHPALGLLLASLGYAPIETIYGRRLD